MKKILFKEEQRFNQIWLLILTVITLLAVAIPFGIGIYSHEVLNKPFDDGAMNTKGLVITGASIFFFMLLMFLILFRLRLKTKITSKKISVSFPPVIRKWRNIYAEDIKSYRIRHYYPRREFGGYGIKRRLRYGTAWIVAGETGLQLYLNDGKKFLIGTQKQNTLEQAMLKLMKGKE